ncbi:MAG: hypothetical protein QOC66_4376 [Pseudonocardiales bacterium]|nr:hypothetical protein [Pseudonocardiales bacterium]
MRSVRIAAAIGVLTEVALLAILAATVGLSGVGWTVGLACGLGSNAALARALRRSGTGQLGLANRITQARAALAGAVAALVADSFVHAISVVALVTLAVVALVLDAVDGQIARRTGGVTAVGARFDMEVDAFLILVLSVDVARSVGVWVLAIGLARYAFVAAYWLVPWLREPVPARYWRKTVAAIQGVVLTFAAASVLPDAVIEFALAIALLLLAESFGRDIWWLRNRERKGAAERVEEAVAVDRSLPRRALGSMATALSALLVWLVLVAPDRITGMTSGALLRIPIEGLIVVSAAVVLPARWRRVTALLAGLALGLLVILKALDTGFYAELDRPFNPVVDRSYFGPAFGVLRDSVGTAWAVTAAVGLVALAVACLVLMPLAMLRVTRHAARRRARSAKALGALGFAWVLCAVLGVQVIGGTRVASTSAAGLAYDEIGKVRTAIHDEGTFAATLAAHDRFAAQPAADLLSGLRGKDVLVVFVESYGRVAVQGSAFSRQVDGVLRSGTASLSKAGFSARSAFLTSPTFGGISWLAHATLQSGVWVDNQQRYDQLVASQRFTLSDAFKSAGWRTVSDVPSDGPTWPEGTSFYHYDQLYNSTNVGYSGPAFSYARIPDQYTMAEFQRRELAPGHRPVMAEIDLVWFAHPVGAATADGRAESGGRRLCVRRHARARTIPRCRLAPRR